MRKIPCLTFVVLLLGACAPPGYIRLARKASPADVKALAEQLEPLLSGGHEPYNAPIADFTKKFAECGCKPEWVAERDLAAERRERARQLVESQPEAAAGLFISKDPKALFAAGYLLKHKMIALPEIEKADADKILNEAAKGGNAHAMFELADALMRKYPFYANVPGDPQKFVEINALLEKAALAGSGRAAYNLGNRTGDYVQAKFPGVAIPGNALSTHAWLEKAARLGDDRAQEALSHVYGGLEIGDSSPTTWLEASARSGNEIANYDLAGSYENGTNGYPMDLDKAIQYHCRSIYFGGQWSPRALEKILAYKEKLSDVGPAFRPTKMIYATGTGSGKYDRMTYAVYTSTMLFVPATDLIAAALKPAIYYCNGLCDMQATIIDDSRTPLAKSFWQGTDAAKAMLVFKKRTPFKKGRIYMIVMTGSTTKSIGIVTVGSGKPDIPVGTTRTVTATMPDRGAIAFELWE